MEKKKLLAFIDAHKSEMLSLWQELVNHDSGNDDKVGIDLLQIKIGEILENLGAEVQYVHYDQAGNLLLAEIRHDRKGAPIVFLGHSDTVFKKGTVGKRPFTITDGKAFGPGVLDMKGGIVIILYAIKALQAIGYNSSSFKIILAGDEENGHQKSDAATVLQREFIGARAVFNCETGFVDDAIIIGRKGVASFTMETFGVAAHVGNNPEIGRSAIVEIAHKLLEIEKLTDKQAAISFNVGTIEGGTVPNATPDYAKIKIDVRFGKDSDITVFSKQLQAIAEQTYIEGTHTQLSLGACLKPMDTTPGVEQLFRFVQATARENNLGHLKARKVGGASDSAYAVSSGIPTVCGMGVKGERNHSKEEYAIVESLYERAKLLALAVFNLDEVNLYQ